MGILNWYTKFWFKLTIAILIWEWIFRIIIVIIIIIIIIIAFIITIIIIIFSILFKKKQRYFSYF